MNHLDLVFPGNPPTGNHYKKPTVRAGHLHWYLTTEAKAWYATVSGIVAGRHLDGERFSLAYSVYTATKRRTDLDNYLKCLQDSLVQAGAIEDDHLIVHLVGSKDYDKDSPRTEVVLRRLS